MDETPGTATANSSRNTVETLATGVGIGLVGQLTGRVMALVSQVVLARLLGPAPFGLYSLGAATLSIVGLGSQLGLDKAVLRFGARQRISRPAGLRRLLRSALGLAFMVGAAAGLALFLAAGWAENLFQAEGLAPVLRAFAPAFALFAGLRVSAAATTLTQDLRYRVKVIDLVQPGLALLLILVAFALSLGVLGAVGATVVSLAVALVVALVDLNRLFPAVGKDLGVDGTGLRTMLKFSLPIAAGTLVALVLHSADRYLVGVFRPVAEVGIYQAAAQASVLYAVILAAFNTTFLPIVADLEGPDQLGQLERLYRVSTKWGLYVSLPLFAVMAIFPQQILRVVFGPEYAQGAVVLVLLAMAQMTNVGTGAVGLLLVMRDQVARWNTILISMLVLHLGLGIVLAPRFGMAGVALSACLATIGQFTLGLLSVRAKLRLWPYDRRYLKGGLSVGLSVVVLLILRSMWSGGFLQLALATMLSLAVFVIGLRALGFDEEDRRFFRLLQGRLQAARAASGR